ncbi:MAG: cell division protein ZipA C-terminal FtsZ-binding domain-containing protein [Steroidobacteraceae bacterium]
MGELRLVLSGICLLLLAGIWWWTVRGSRQARGAPELRESSAGPQAVNPAPAAPVLRDAVVRDALEPRDWGVSPLEPLSIKTADFDRVPILDMPMMADTEVLDENGEFEEITIDREQKPEAQAEKRQDEAPILRPSPSPAPRSPQTSELQKIVTLRVCAVGETRWPGTQLITALESQGLAYGRYQVYHRNHADGRSLFCVASLVEPGTFDAAHMAEQDYRGISLFAVLPGPAESLQTIDALLATARGLAEELRGSVQDAKGVPMSPQRTAALREEVVRFQELLA